jgi:hypothetical protein
VHFLSKRKEPEIFAFDLDKSFTRLFLSFVLSSRFLRNVFEAAVIFRLYRIPTHDLVSAL